jgi:methyltransferase-like protein 6
MKKICYYDHDFDFMDVNVSGSESQNTSIDDTNYNNEDQVDKWNEFYRVHKTGSFFKARNYIYSEFYDFLDNSFSHDDSTNIICEVGCGYGCTLFPLLQRLPRNVKYLATDCSNECLSLLMKNKMFESDRIMVHIWNVTENELSVFVNSAKVVLAVFSLSAIKPQDHIKTLTNIRLVMKPNGYLFIRDYGINDITMFRHKKRIQEHFYMRSDGTLCYYFSIDSINKLAEATGFSVVEIDYVCILNRNRKTGISMRRIFIHAVLQKNFAS